VAGLGLPVAGLVCRDRALNGRTNTCSVGANLNLNTSDGIAGPGDVHCWLSHMIYNNQLEQPQLNNNKEEKPARLQIHWHLDPE